MYPKSLINLIQDLKTLPGVGEKTAERYALKLLETDIDSINRLRQDLIDIKTKVHHCVECGNLAEEDKCSICKDSSRDHDTICVVQEAKDVYALEKTGYKGVYHVLNGAISTTKGILPQDINLETLLLRVNENTKEVIIATNPTLDGETTALYITKLLKNKDINVTRLAHGLPMGGNLDYIDELTLIKAMDGRTKQ